MLFTLEKLLKALPAAYVGNMSIVDEMGKDICANGEFKNYYDCEVIQYIVKDHKTTIVVETLEY